MFFQKKLFLKFKKKSFPQKKISATKFFPKKKFFQEKFFYQKNFFQKKFFKLVFFRNKIFSKKFLFLKKLILQKKFSKNRIFSAKLRNKSELGYFYYFFVIFYSLLFIQKYIPGSIVYFVLFPVGLNINFTLFDTAFALFSDLSIQYNRIQTFFFFALLKS